MASLELLSMGAVDYVMATKLYDLIERTELKMQHAYVNKLNMLTTYYEGVYETFRCYK